MHRRGLFILFAVAAGLSPVFPGPAGTAAERVAVSTGADPANVDITASTTSAAVKIAQAYGVESAYQIEALTFVFNVQHGNTRIRREWLWDIADNRVEYDGDGPTGLPVSVTYRRDRMTVGDADLNRAVDDWFVDDQYWLLFPFHLAWEKRLAVEQRVRQPMRIHPGVAGQVIVRYPPGSSLENDVYEVYYGPNHLIREWAFVPAGAREPDFVTTWEAHARAGPVLFSLSHRSGDGSFRVWFDRVAVKLADRGWVDAVPLDRAVSRTSDGAGEDRERL